MLTSSCVNWDAVADMFFFGGWAKQTMEEPESCVITSGPNRYIVSFPPVIFFFFSTDSWALFLIPVACLVRLYTFSLGENFAQSTPRSLPATFRHSFHLLLLLLLRVSVLLPLVVVSLL